MGTLQSAATVRIVPILLKKAIKLAATAARQKSTSQIAPEASISITARVNAPLRRRLKTSLATFSTEYAQSRHQRGSALCEIGAQRSGA